MSRIAVCAGVHASPYALAAMLDCARRRGCARFLELRHDDASLPHAFRCAA